MTTIDHRILIPAGPELVWTYVSDITHNPDWQVDCSEVIFLTSRREGPGLRWRYSTPGGHEYVIAVTAWYNGLGYEYYFVDGTSFRENKGRIRLQEIPEGTIVQWTFTYELGGVLGGMRNALGMNRQVDQTISESLKQLWQKLKQSGISARPFEAKSLMREAPDVDARSAYTPRHPSPVGMNDTVDRPRPIARPMLDLPPIEAEPPIAEDDGQPINIFVEPPIAEDDTRQRRAVTPTSTDEHIPVDIEGEPEFLDRMVDLSRFEPPREPTDTQPGKPVEAPAATIAPASEPEPEPKQEAPAPAKPSPVSAETSSMIPPRGEETEPLAYPTRSTVPDYQTMRPEPTREPEPEPSILSTPVVKYRELVEKDAPQPEEAAPIAPAAQVSEPPAAKVYTVEAPAPTTEPVKEEPEPALRSEPAAATEAKSIWEVFGVPRPSETGEAAAVTVEATPETSVVASAPEAAKPAEPITTPAAAAANVVATAPEPAEMPDKLSFPPASTRTGLRLALRRRTVSLRRP